MPPHASPQNLRPAILIIDDDRAFLNHLENYVRGCCPDLEVRTCDDPVKGLAAIHPELELLLLDLEMPGLDGMKMLGYAVAKGLSKTRIIILSGRDADYLHQRFPMGSCLAVLNKHEIRQKQVLDMIFRALQRKHGVPEENAG
ncbi:response regulator [Geoalkalibacter halelectricus]|uniref:Response regulator n=1 Tax=Geoalkalibacter halelectricus TaxID=2847045 RepID=A0ABY5ZIR8_9BACT|nr:response regulator [Geoalkalibacter halelectricus]MDO3378944.1 response regulator [Geoalkalibacter halelectricus]UWZ79033.1 response regulator [Geoalkalibacter halelectricus]